MRACSTGAPSRRGSSNRSTTGSRPCGPTGARLDGAFYYDGSPTTRHARNLEANPACSLSLEDGRQAVMLEGTSTATRADADDLGARISEAFGKYHDDGYAPKPDAWAGERGGGLRVFTPVTAMAWFSFPTDATRFVFG
jgi:hypothetical protein